MNEALLRLRRRRADTLHDEAALEALPDPAPPSPAHAGALERALLQLPAITRSVIWLHAVEGDSHDEIGRMLQRSASFSKSQHARGLRRLRALLEDPGALPHAP